MQISLSYVIYDRYERRSAILKFRGDFPTLRPLLLFHGKFSVCICVHNLTSVPGDLLRSQLSAGCIRRPVSNSLDNSPPSLLAGREAKLCLIRCRWSPIDNQIFFSHALTGLAFNDEQRVCSLSIAHIVLGLILKRLKAEEEEEGVAYSCLPIFISTCLKSASQ